MAIVSLNTIKQWFKTGLKPTQLQFWNTWDSFWHKEEIIPITKIENLSELFNEKADNEALKNHYKDQDAHGLLKVKNELLKKGVKLSIKEHTIFLSNVENEILSEIKIPSNEQTVAFLSGIGDPNNSDQAKLFVEKAPNTQLLFWEGVIEQSAEATKTIKQNNLDTNTLVNNSIIDNDIYLYNRVTKKWQSLFPWDSYWHKQEKIPISNIKELPEILNKKVDEQTLTEHNKDENAHGLNLIKDELRKKGVKLKLENNKLALLDTSDKVISKIELPNSPSNQTVLFKHGEGNPNSSEEARLFAESSNFDQLLFWESRHLDKKSRRQNNKLFYYNRLTNDWYSFSIKNTIPEDFYSQGTFNPKLIDLGGGATYSGTFIGAFVKVGNMVTIQIDLSRIVTKGVPKGNLIIEGLPFPIKYPTGFSVGRFFNASLPEKPEEKIYSIHVGTDSGGTSLGIKLKNDTKPSIPQNFTPIKFLNGYLTISGSCIIE